MISRIVTGIGLVYGTSCLFENLQRNKNIFTSKKIQSWLLIISYVIFFFYILGNNKKLISDNIINSIAFNDVITLYKVSIAVQSIYFSYLLTQSIPQKWQNFLNKIIIFLFILLLIIVGYFIIFSTGLILKT